MKKIVLSIIVFIVFFLVISLVFFIQENNTGNTSQNMKKTTIIKDENTPEVIPLEYKIISKASDQLTISITWQIRNPRNSTLFMLKTLPIIIENSNPIILDHSSPGKFPEFLSFNHTPKFSILKVPPISLINEKLEYNLLPPKESLIIEGIFGYSYIPIDSETISSRNWIKAKEWQNIVYSKQIIIEKNS